MQVFETSGEVYKIISIHNLAKHAKRSGMDTAFPIPTGCVNPTISCINSYNFDVIMNASQL